MCRDSLLYKGSEDDEGLELEVTGWACVTAALTATPSSDLNTQVESFRDEQEVPLFVLLLATLAGSSRSKRIGS